MKNKRRSHPPNEEVSDEGSHMDSEDMASDVMSSADENGSDSEAMDTDNDQQNGDNGTEESEDNEEDFTEESAERTENTAKDNEIQMKGLTVQELNNFRETEALFHSNLFRLQVIDLLFEQDTLIASLYFYPFIVRRNVIRSETQRQISESNRRMAQKFPKSFAFH